MATPAFSDETLAQRLAMDVCDQWKQETGRKALSVDDLSEIKEWIHNSRATISSFPSLRALAIKGINALIAQQCSGGPVGAE